MIPSAIVCGVDEAGRGPLAGPVCAAAVVLDSGRPIAGLADSKTLSAAARELLREEIVRRAAAWSVAMASVEEIDRHNILEATMLAMQRAVLGLSLVPTEVLVDGNRCPRLPMPARGVVRGDATEPAISAASILAKTARDEVMLALHRQYPIYGFDGHKGYPTAAHVAALRAHGACPAHRRSFRPVRDAMAGDAP